MSLSVRGSFVCLFGWLVGVVVCVCSFLHGECVCGCVGFFVFLSQFHYYVFSILNSWFCIISTVSSLTSPPHPILSVLLFLFVDPASAYSAYVYSFYSFFVLCSNVPLLFHVSLILYPITPISYLSYLSYKCCLSYQSYHALSILLISSPFLGCHPAGLQAECAKLS